MVAALVVLAVPTARRAMRWRLPAFKESSLAQVASAMSLMLRSGVPLDQALALVVRLEQGTRAEPELATWSNGSLRVTESFRTWRACATRRCSSGWSRAAAIWPPAKRRPKSFRDAPNTGLR